MNFKLLGRGELGGGNVYKENHLENHTTQNTPRRPRGPAPQAALATKADTLAPTQRGRGKHTEPPLWHPRRSRGRTHTRINQQTPYRSGSSLHMYKQTCMIHWYIKLGCASQICQSLANIWTYEISDSSLFAYCYSMYMYVDQKFTTKRAKENDQKIWVGCLWKRQL
jgi:hypothetical protein